MTIQRFNIRVYGLLLHEGNVLLSSENYKDRVICKFPGGGLEYGEGLEDALKREFMEETGLDIGLAGLYYVNEFFQQSAFSEQDQIVSVYYLVEPDETNLARLEEHFIHGTAEHHIYWRSLDELKSGELTFPIDQEVARRLTSDAGLRKNS